MPPVDVVVYILLAPVVIFGALALIVEVARILNGDIISFLGPVGAIALLDEFLGDSHCASEAGVIAKYGSQEWCCVVECRSSQAKVKFKGTSEFLVPRAAELGGICAEKVLEA